MAELGTVANSVKGAVAKAGGDVNAWVEAYTSKDGWYRMDQAQRRLEAWVANLDDEPEERALGVVRRALRRRLPSDGRRLHEGPREGELGGLDVDCTRLASTARSSPSSRSPSRTSSSTPCGSRWVVELVGAAAEDRRGQRPSRHRRAAEHHADRHGRSSAGRVGELQRRRARRQARRAHRDAFLPDLAARKKFAAARVPKLVDVALDELLSLQPSKLAKKVDGAQVVVVRSQEIDHAGEAGFTFQARQVMDTVIDNLARGDPQACRSRRRARQSSSADHGHLFFPADRDESMRIDAPGGDERRSSPPLLDRSRRDHAFWLHPRRRVGSWIRIRSRFRLSERLRGVQGRR